MSEDPQDFKLMSALEGHVGKLRLYRSGRATMQIGDVVFDVSRGVETSFYQQVVHIVPSKREWHELGCVAQRLVVTPDISSLLPGLSEL